MLSTHNGLDETKFVISQRTTDFFSDGGRNIVDSNLRDPF